MTQREIAKLLGCTVQAVQITEQRALRKLRVALAETAVELGWPRGQVEARLAADRKEREIFRRQRNARDRRRRKEVA